MSDEETLTLIQQAARRWALERGVHWAGQMAPASDEELVSRLVKELAEQGWFPESPEEWGDTPWVTLVRLGRILAREIPAAFLPVLTHWLGLQLLAPELRGANACSAGPIATSPYIDYSKSRSTVVAVPAEGGWVLDGLSTWVINAHQRSRFALVANLSEGTPLVFDLNCAQSGCCLGEPLAPSGLWGVPVRHLQLCSVRLGAESLVAEGSRAETLLGNGYRAARWGVLSLLCGALERFYEHALTYAEVRIQGGRRISGHAPVLQLLDRTRAAVDSFAHLLERCERYPEADFASEQVRHQARRACDSAFQVFGGIAYICPGLPERCWRDVHQAVTLCTGLLA